MISFGLKAGQKVAGFRVASLRLLPEYRSTAIHLIHEETGGEALHLANEDPENLFAFAFRTPPSDDTGAAHILEHSVLCGSRGFPLKDPFAVLLKTSLQTFLNAWTFPDKTVYPAASRVEKDFYNLMRVYGDAVFFPLLREEAFWQEAHRLELAAGGDEEPRLRRVGVVLNEMKGSFSSPEELAASWTARSLFPDTPYGRESGGDPEFIPSLTYEALKEFHRRYYHPSNCLIFLYGNLPTPRTLELLQRSFLRSFEREAVDSVIPDPAPWREPRSVVKTYPVKPDEAERRPKATVSLNWRLGPATDQVHLLLLEVLAEALVGHAGAPLHRILIESRLGEDLAPSTGLETELKQAIFSAGLRGVEAERATQVEGLILTELNRLRAGSLPADLLEAAIHRVEFRNREIRRGGRPYSLRLLRRTLRGWLHGGDPVESLEFEPWMERIRGPLREGVLEETLERWFLANPNRTTLVVKPDSEQMAREEARERSSMKKLEEGLSEKDERAIRERMERLQAFQVTPERGPDTRRIPSLKLADVPRKVERIPVQPLEGPSGIPLLYHDLFSRGIVYLDIAIDLHGLDFRLLPLLPFYGKAVCGCGLPGVPFTETARRLSLYTGGFWSGLRALTPVGGEETLLHLFFQVKMLEAKTGEALELVRALLENADFQDLRRLQDLLLEYRNDLKASLVPGGSAYAALRAESGWGEALAVQETWKGISQYLAVNALVSRLEGQAAELARDLTAIRAELLKPSRWLLNLTCDREALPGIRETLGRLFPARMETAVPFLEKEPATPQGFPTGTGEGGIEGLALATQVGFVAAAFPGPTFLAPEAAHAAALTHLLTTGFLWEKVRMQGGAYGAGFSANTLEGVATFTSYRDPHVEKTLEAFREALDYAASGRIGRAELQQGIIGAAGREDPPLDPGEAGLLSLSRELAGITDEMRQLRRERLLGMSAADLSACARSLREVYGRSRSVVLSSPKALEEVKRRGGPILEIP